MRQGPTDPTGRVPRALSESTAWQTDTGKPYFLTWKTCFPVDFPFNPVNLLTIGFRTASSKEARLYRAQIKTLRNGRFL